ncbi:MAG TPA: dephospho-CoA kinase [archaeon]|nr:dephospho-CoA kinase [archaeon]
MLVGVTGNLAVGKSALMHVFHRLGFKAYYADEMVYRLYEEKEDLKQKIGKEFGSTVINAGYVDNELLAIIVFGDKKKLEKLNSIVHPLIKDEIKKIDHKEKTVFVEVPLLFEAGFEKMFEKIILVDCSREVALSRALETGMTEGDFEKRVSVQWGAEKKKPKCDFVVDSNVSMHDLSKKAEEIAAKLKGESK